MPRELTVADMQILWARR